jgi:hypothetical protein
MQIGIYNHSTGIQEVRDMTEAELSEFTEQAAQHQANLEAIATEEAEKLAAKEAVLAKLGLTAEEAAAILA